VNLFGLTKAFDTVNHLIFIEKLATYGVRGIVLNWFTSHLRSNIQFY